MRIGFHARVFATEHLRGWSRYALNLLREMGTLSKKENLLFFLYTDIPLNKDLLHLLGDFQFEIREKKGLNFVHWEQVVLPRLLKKDQIDVFHCPINYGLPLQLPCPSVITIHDAIREVYYESDLPVRKKLSIAWLKIEAFHRISRWRADRIITVSHHAKQDLMRYLQVPASKIQVIYEAADPIFERVEPAKEIQKRYQLPKLYFFYIGGWEKRKNVPFLIKAFLAAQRNSAEGHPLRETQLILAGGGNSGFREKISAELNLSGDEKIQWLGWIPDEDLPALYRGARAFIYPSEYEGFGLQLCEAMISGCPVLAAHKSSLPEILGSGGDTFNLSDQAELIEQMQKITIDEEYFQILKKRAKQRATDFNWRKTAAKTIELYKGLLK